MFIDQNACLQQLNETIPIFCVFNACLLAIESDDCHFTSV